VEEFVTARLLRDAQVLPIWEGTTNICVLDALRAIGREEAGSALLGAVRARLASVRHARLLPLRAATERALAGVVGELEAMAAEPGGLGGEAAQHRARRFCDRLVSVYQITHALAEAERLEGSRAGGRDALIAERLLVGRLAA